MAGMNIGGDSQNTTPIAIQAGMQARTMVQATGEAAKVATWKDVFSKSTLDAVKKGTISNAALGDALQQQSMFVRFARKIPFLGDRLTQFLGTKTSALNDAIVGLTDDVLGGASKAKVTQIILEGGPDVASKLGKAGLSSELAKDLAAKGAEAAAESGAKVAAQSVGKNAAQAIVKEVSDDAIKTALTASKNGGMLAGKQLSVDAIKQVVANGGDDVVGALRAAGMRADTAKAIAAEATKAGAASTATQAATTGAAKAASGVKGFLGKLLSGAKGNFIIAGIFSLGSNAIQLATGKMNLKQFAVLTGVDTAAYGAIGMGSAAAGAAIGSVVPVLGTAIGFVAGLAIGMAGGWLYEKFIRTPIKNALGGSGKANDPAAANGQGVQPGNEYQDPYNPAAAQAVDAASRAATQATRAANGGYDAPMPWQDQPAQGGLTYEQALAQLNGQ